MNWDKVREWIKVGALVVIAFSMLQIAGLLRGIDSGISMIESEISMIETSLSGMHSEIGAMEVDLEGIFEELNEMH